MTIGICRRGAVKLTRPEQPALAAVQVETLNGAEGC